MADFTLILRKGSCEGCVTEPSDLQPKLRTSVLVGQVQPAPVSQYYNFLSESEDHAGQN